MGQKLGNANEHSLSLNPSIYYWLCLRLLLDLMFLLFPCHRLIQRSFEAFVFLKSCSADSRQNDLIFNYAVQIFHNVTNDGDGRRWRSAVSVAATTLCGVFVFFVWHGWVGRWDCWIDLFPCIGIVLFISWNTKIGKLFSVYKLSIHILSLSPPTSPMDTPATPDPVSIPRPKLLTVF